MFFGVLVIVIQQLYTYLRGFIESKKKKKQYKIHIENNIINCRNFYERKKTRRKRKSRGGDNNNNNNNIELNDVEVLLSRGSKKKKKLK